VTLIRKNEKKQYNHIYNTAACSFTVKQHWTISSLGTRL